MRYRIGLRTPKINVRNPTYETEITFPARGVTSPITVDGSPAACRAFENASA